MDHHNSRDEASRPVLAAALSLVVPGLGQLYNRQVIKGLLVFFFAFLVLPYIYGVIDAYFVARRGDTLPAAPRRAGLLAAAPPRVQSRRASFETQLVEAARAHDGSLSVTEGVEATGRTFKEVERRLDEMARSGYVDIDNRPDTGVVVYRFTQMAA